MIGSLEGKVAIVTGGARGLGRQHALALARAGAAVLVNDLGVDIRGDGTDSGPAQAVADEIRAAGGTALANVDTVAEWEAAGRIVAAAVDVFGRLDIVINNAGVSRMRKIDQASREDWELTVAVNLNGPAAITHWAATHWHERGPESGRAIVNISSPAGTHPLPGSAAYCATKAGVLALTITSAAELAGLGVRVNAVAPMGRTRMAEAADVPLDFLRKPEFGFDRIAVEHVSPLVVYLSSPGCRFTGRAFGIEGDDVFLFDGFTARHRFNNREQQWTVETLSAALRGAPVQDETLMIAPGFHGQAFQPSDETLAVLAGVGVATPA